ncbi:MAG TPA: UDP-glucuronic acid decarboxylase family protein [Dehalococcoidia bacterium]|nr:UDP-glucuronic acid decarboxylase family protein [Dehalococcoidia bacterium]
MRALIAGGGGFIGSHLCERLLGEGHEVICVDNFITGRRTNVAPLLEHARFTLVESDIIGGLPDLPTVDHVYHLASPASPPGYKRYPIETLRVNSEGSRHLLELALRDGARFLYTSTSEVYGDPLEHPQREEYRGNVSSIGPRSMYDEAKRYGEALVTAYHRDLGADARIVRIFNTYGPHSDPEDGRLIPNLITQALRREPMTIYADGQQTRSLCYVSDLVDGLVRMMESAETAGTVVNLGNPEEHTVLEYAELIRELTGSASEFVFTQPAVGDDPQRRRPDISRARSLLQWGPRVSLREGLSLTVEYFRHELASPAPEPPPAWLKRERVAAEAGGPE